MTICHHGEVAANRFVAPACITSGHFPPKNPVQCRSTLKGLSTSSNPEIRKSEGLPQKSLSVPLSHRSERRCGPGSVTSTSASTAVGPLTRCR
jgi:hypothetical protein